MNAETFLQSLIRPMGTFEYWLWMVGLVVMWYVFALVIAQMTFSANRKGGDVGALRAVRTAAWASWGLVVVAALALGYFSLFRGALGATVGFALVTSLLTMVLNVIFTRGGRS